jgi:hypothetical protein
MVNMLRLRTQRTTLAKVKAHINVRNEQADKLVKAGNKLAHWLI